MVNAKHWLSYISNAALLSLKLLLYAGRNINYSKKWLCDLFLMKTFHQ